MAARDRDRLGSTVSLAQLSGGETIPREYHRRVLKKIAQLTKVIYALNTKVDENEDFVANLRSVHEAEIKRLLDDSASKLQKCEAGFIKEKESADRQVSETKRELEETKEERDDLHDQQVSYRKEVAEQLTTLKSQHTTKVQSLVKDLERFRGEQTKQLKEINDLRESYSRKSGQQLKSLKLQHEEELAKLKHHSEQEIQQLQRDIASTRTDHTKEIESLNKKIQSQLEAQRETLTSTQNDLLSKERKEWEEKEKSLKAIHLEKEEHLKQQISMLSKDLRDSSDKLALAEQRVRDLESSCDENVAGTGTLKALLEKSEGDIERLRATVGTLHTELDISKEKYKQQAAELRGISGTVGKLEALRVSNEGVIENLCSQIESFQSKLKLLEEEREGLQTSQYDLKEKQAATIKALEREVDKMRREKQQLHAQFAREIEAAHAQLGHRETELGNEHLRALQQLKDEHTKDLSNAKAEKEVVLGELKQEILSQKEDEIQILQGLYASEVSKLRSELSDKTSRLDLALEELKRLKSDLLKGEKGLGSATSQIDKLREELKQAQSGLLASQRHCEQSMTENAQLKTTVESLKRQKKELNRGHVEELKKTRADLTAELEAVWKERVKRECASLRAELSQNHSEDTQSALTELASLKDGVLRQAQDKWESDKRDLIGKIEDLEHKLRELQQSASASLEETKSMSGNRIESLRSELENETLRHQVAMKNLQKAHEEQLLSIQTQNEKESQVLITRMSDQHSEDVRGLHKANQLAVTSLREKMEKEREDKLRLTATEHQEELHSFEARLESEFKDKMARMNLEHVAEIERFRQQIEKVVAQSQRQAAIQEGTATSLRQELESRDSELSILRNKTNSLTVALADLKKQLTMSEKEVQAAKREAMSTLRIREQQLVAAHHAELESINSQQRHKAQQLLSDFNKAKTLLNVKIHELERELSEWERRYKSRDSKPEDIAAIRELRSIVREQEQRMKDLVAEKRVYQLELMNREKNYNKLFSVNPHVGVLNPLQSKQRKQVHVLTSESQTQKYASAPSLLSPSPELPSIHSYPHLTPLSQSTTVNLTTLHDHSNASLTSSNSQLSKKTQMSQSSLESKPQKLVMLKDSPLTHKRSSKSNKKSESGRKTLGSHSAPLQPIDTHSQTVVSPQKHSMVVQ